MVYPVHEENINEQQFRQQRKEIKMYLYNTRTHKLHIEGYCHNAVYSRNNPTYKAFATESDVREYTKGEFLMCYFCSKKRDKILSQSKNTL